jgi:hypothetical protein
MAKQELYDWAQTQTPIDIGPCTHCRRKLGDVLDGTELGTNRRVIRSRRHRRDDGETRTLYIATFTPIQTPCPRCHTINVYPPDTNRPLHTIPSWKPSQYR